MFYSFEKLKALSKTAQACSSGSVTLVLPERPSDSETDLRPFLNGAISMLSESATYLYDDRRYLDCRLDELDKKVERVDKKGDDHFKYIQKQFKAIKDDLKTFATKDDLKAFATKDDLKAFATKDDLKAFATKDDLKVVKDDLKASTDKLEASTDNLMAVARNRLVTRLNLSIEKVRALVQDQAGQSKNIVAPDFPLTVRRFWYLKSNSKLIKFSNMLINLTLIVPALQRLAKHYAIDGWQDWKIHESEDADATQYDTLEVAIAAHPELCLQALAVKWGLEYGQLERPMVQGVHPTVRKRKAYDELEPRRVKHRQTSEYVADLSILSIEGQEVIIRRRTTISEPDARVHVQTTLEEVLKEHNVPGHGEMSEESAELRYGTDSSTQLVRHHIKAVMGLDPDPEHTED